MNILEKNLLLLASAGSGKTFTLSDRIIGLIATGVEPENIVALTFTRKAAREFADAILQKLAQAAKDPHKAARLDDRFKTANTDFTDILERVVRNLPRLTLSTMDSFFSKIVRTFQYELGISGGRFELIQGQEAEMLRNELLEKLLEDTLSEKEGVEFMETFRRATFGEEKVNIAENLDHFVADWHGLYRTSPRKTWGPKNTTLIDPSEWEKQKHHFISLIRRDWPNLSSKNKSAFQQLEPMLKAFTEHTIGSGKLGKASGLIPKILEALPDTEGSIEITYRTNFTITGMAAQALRELIQLAAQCEFSAAAARTRGVHGVIQKFDQCVEKEFRSKGKLGFDDVKILMGAWMDSEEARLRREAIDFRLDSHFRHWLLDEFQDTSRIEWNALLPLIDESLSNEDSTAFIVGDKKQAIYAWRGGDVGLFDELQHHYQNGIQSETMTDSWRSCPEILETVNQVFGDHSTMELLFSTASQAWKWDEHYSAEPLLQPARRGHTSVEIIAEEEQEQRIVDILKDLGIGEKNLTCGILVQTNLQVQRLADALREAGFQVVEEGERRPGQDHPVGVLITQILRWLANPADRFAEQTIRISPLAHSIEHTFGMNWKKTWQELSSLTSRIGFSATITQLFHPLIPQLEAFGKRRVETLIEALSKLDQLGIYDPRQVAERIHGLKISQSPGVAAVQIMTVHKSKGLGFDVVILPEVPTEVIPNYAHYNIMMGDEWLSIPPTKWARNIIPELRETDKRWAKQQTYESLCKLYVAMTRAKQGLYVLLDPVPKSSQKTNKASLSNWLYTSLNLTEKAYSTGDPNWSHKIAACEIAPIKTQKKLGSPIAKRSRLNPSNVKKYSPTLASRQGQQLGTAIHKALEMITWLDVSPLHKFPPEVDAVVQRALSTPEIRQYFLLGNRRIDLFREQSIEALIGEEWLSGIIDRLHIHISPAGDITHVEIIDFKTDRVSSAEELGARYEKQMRAYSAAVAQIYSHIDVKCLLLSTHLGEVIPL